MSKASLNYPTYLYNEGTNYNAYKLFRTRYVAYQGKKLWRFRCYAPNAKSVSLVGDFNNWNPLKNPMEKLNGGIYQVFVKGLKKFNNYKFYIETKDGTPLMKADPYALHAETAPGTASKIYDISNFVWSDQKFLANRKNLNSLKAPLNIYELHLGSFKRNENKQYLNYTTLADEIIPYILEMGYTHIELMPITEYPFDGSWGYQINGMYAPTSRYGTPHDFQYFINKCHENNIGVIMDIVLSHFPKDAHGLYNFDGTPLFEYSDPLKREHQSWGTMVFDFGKGSVISYLTSAVYFWAEEYHIDGFRLDAVASMLYLDYDRKDKEWRRNKDGGNYNLEAIDFLRYLNKTILTAFPDVLMIAEESTSFPMVTLPPDLGGLGFTYKWNMGWMNDTLDYIKIDPFFRKGAHNKLTFSLTYAYSENFILPFSHDEVVHGKASMISKMPGKYMSKFDQLKTLYAFQISHPGKKLNFMGNEFGQFIEWDYQNELDWCLLEFDTHYNLKKYVKALNFYYKQNPEMYELDNVYDGFKWLVVDDNVQNVLAYYRTDAENNITVVVINFSEMNRKDYEIGVPESGTYVIALNSNDKSFGGVSNLETEYDTKKEAKHNQKQLITLQLDGNSAIFLKLKKTK